MTVKPNKIQVRKLIEGHYQSLVDNERRPTTEAQIKAEAKVIAKALAREIKAFETAAARKATAAERLRVALKKRFPNVCSWASHCDPQAYIENQIERRPRNNTKIAQLRNSERQLLARLEIAETRDDIEKILRSIGLVK